MKPYNSYSDHSSGPKSNIFSDLIWKIRIWCNKIEKQSHHASRRFSTPEYINFKDGLSLIKNLFAILARHDRLIRNLVKYVLTLIDSSYGANRQNVDRHVEA